MQITWELRRFHEFSFALSQLLNFRANGGETTFALADRRFDVPDGLGTLGFCFVDFRLDDPIKNQAIEE